jgi:hypothetical protein
MLPPNERDLLSQKTFIMRLAMLARFLQPVAHLLESISIGISDCQEIIYA